MYVSGQAAGSVEVPASLHQDSTMLSTADGTEGSPWCVGAPSSAVDAVNPEHDHGRPGSSTEACASQPGEMGEIGLGMDMGLSARTIFILDSDEEEDIARAIAASLERSTVDASMNDFSLEEMD